MNLKLKPAGIIRPIPPPRARPVRKERLTYHDLLRRLLAGRLLRLEERRLAEEILGVGDTTEVAVRLGELLERIAERGGLVRMARRSEDNRNVRRYLDSATNDHWTVELAGPGAVHTPPSRPAPAESPESAAETAPAPSATPPERAAAPPQIVRAVEEVRLEPMVARRFVDDATGEPLRTLFGTFAPCRTPEELGAALAPLRAQLVAITSATDVRFHLLSDADGTLVAIPVRDGAETPHESLAGRVIDQVLGERKMLHIPNVSAKGVGIRPGTQGALVPVPLVSGDHALGLMEVVRATPGPFADDELALFRVAGLSAGGIIARAEVLEKLIFLDRLTGLYNRAYFDDQIEREIERANRNGTSVALVMADLDHFKRINDTYGHQVGDQALSHLGSIIRSNVRQIDLAARYGGEEFALLLPGITRARTAQTAERLRRVVADTRFGDVIPELDGLRLSISLGFALYPDDAGNAKQLIDRADRVALYAAKNRGRNRVVPWSAAREPQSGVGS